MEDVSKEIYSYMSQCGYYVTHQDQVPLPLRVQLTKTLNGRNSIWDLKSVKVHTILTILQRPY